MQSHFIFQKALVPRQRFKKTKLGEAEGHHLTKLLIKS